MWVSFSSEYSSAVSNELILIENCLKLLLKFEILLLNTSFKFVLVGPLPLSPLMVI